MGDFAAAHKYLEQARALYEPDDTARFRYQYGQDIGASALCYLAWTLWLLGYVEQASSVADEAVRHAEALGHPHTLAYTICHARGMMDVFRRSSEDTRSYAGRVTATCRELGFPFWGAGGRILEGWALTRGGEVERGLELLRDGLADWRKTGGRTWLPMFLALEAEGLAKAGMMESALAAIDGALAMSDDTGERWALAEVLRIKAGLLSAATRSPDAVETLLLRSKDVARVQQARSWELRTSCDLARIWQARGQDDDAFTMLNAIYKQFTEGFDTEDLRTAQALLRSLRPEWSPSGRVRTSSPDAKQL
jgi:predicted ATPase